MHRESLLVAVAGAVVLAAGTAALVVPGAVAEQTEDDVVPSDLDLRETTISPAGVGGEAVTLELTTRLTHRGGPAENVTVQVRATDAASGIVETTATTDIGRIRAAGERAVTTNVTVPREGGYVIETLVYENGRRIASGEREIRGLAALTPAYARTAMEFREGDRGLPPVTFTVEEVTDGRARLRVSAALTNTGAETVKDLELVVLAQQADSNIVADRARTDIGSVRSGRTTTPSVTLTVPDEYNYRLYAVLKRDGVELGTARASALLSPERTVPENTTTEEVELETGAFAEEATDRPEPEPTGTPAEGGSGPGFGVAVALLGMVLAALVYGRRPS